MSLGRDYTPPRSGQHAKPKRRRFSKQQAGRSQPVAPTRKARRSHYKAWRPVKINGGSSLKGTQVL